MNKIRATYQKKREDYIISVDYTYYWEYGDYVTPGGHDIDITEVYIDDYSIPLEFFYDYIYEDLEEEIFDNALGNRN
jgi:hypothetical protein